MNRKKKIQTYYSYIDEIMIQISQKEAHHHHQRFSPFRAFNISSSFTRWSVDLTRLFIVVQRKKRKKSFFLIFSKGGLRNRRRSSHKKQ